MKTFFQKEKSAIVIFSAFFIILLFQFFNVGIYYDDYGYLSLSYCVPTPHEGHVYTVSQLISFMGEHYANVNGRFIQVFIWLMLFKIGGLGLVRVAAAAVLTVIAALSYSLTSKEKSTVPGALRAVLLCLCFFIIPLEIHRHGTYWFVAFFIYYLPLIALVLFAKYYTSCSNLNKIFKSVIIVILVFLSSWSVENVAAACVGMTGLLFIIKTVKEKRFAFSEALYTISAGFGMTALLLSPGIIKRATETAGDVDLLHRIKNSVTMVFFSLFSDYMRPFMSVLIAAALIMSVYLFFRCKKLVFIANSVVLIPVAVIELFKPRIFHDAIVLNLVWLIASVALAGAVLLPIFSYYILSEQHSKAVVVGIGVLSVMALAGVPSFPERVFITFMMVSSIVIADSVSLFYELVSDRKKPIFAVAFALAFLAFGITATVNFGKIFIGYRTNAHINIENEARLKDAADRIKAGEEIAEIHLLRFEEENDKYATVMFYEQPGNWFKGMIENYYEIPGYVELIYE